MLPESLSCPFFSNCAVRSEMVTKPSSFTVNSPSKVRTGMPPASAGAAALLSKSIEPSNAKPSANAGTTVASKIQLGFGQADDKGLRVDAVALNLDMVDFFIQFFSKRVQHGFCIEADAFAGKMGARAHILQAAARNASWFSTLMSSSTPVLSKAPSSAKRRLQAERDAAGRHAPRRLQVLHVQ